MSMGLIICQHEWVEQCKRRYKLDPPEGYWFEEAHYPLSERLGGTETTPLWYPDHVVQGVLQTLEYRFPCIFTRNTNELNILTTVYPEYVDLYHEAVFICKSYAGSISGRMQWEQKLGMFNRERKEVSLSCRKGAHTVQERLGPLLGLTPEEVRTKNIKSAETQRNRGVGIFGINPEERSEMSRKAASKTNSQKWVDPDHPEMGYHSPGTLVQMQKKRGYPHGPENRQRVYSAP